MNKSSTRYFSNKQEKRVAKNLKGKTIPNSGAIMFAAGDVVTEDWLIECKTKMTESNSMSIKREWLEKNEEEAFAMGKQHCAVCFNMGNSNDYYIISEKEFKRFLELEKELYVNGSNT